MYPILRFVGFTVLFQLAAIGIAGQDLGSSNKLFGRNPPAATKTTTKKAAPKKKRTATAKRSTSKTARAKQSVVKSKSQARSGPETSTAATARKPAIDAATRSRFEDLIESGNTARDQRNYAAAEAAYKTAASLLPTDPRAVYGLGNLASDQQRWDVAEEHYKSALRSDPSNVFMMIALSYVLTQPISLPDLAARYDEAGRLARRAITISPNNALAHDQLGVSLEMRGFISAETENAYRRAIQLEPEFAPAHAHLGRLLRRRGLVTESEKSYKRAVELSTDAATATLVAEVMQSELRYKESESLLRRALKDDPNNPTALNLIGRALVALENFADAEMFLRRSLALSGNAFIPNSLLASLYARQRRFELAENALLQAVRFVPPYERTGLSRQFETVGDGYAKAGKKSNAERAYRQAFNLDSERGSLAVKLNSARPG